MQYWLMKAMITELKNYSLENLIKIGTYLYILNDINNYYVNKY